MISLDAAQLALLLIIMMGLVTFLMRTIGYWAMGHVTLSSRVRHALDALPGSIVAATVLPIVAKSGAPALIAVCAALTVMMYSRNSLIAVAAGVTVGALSRAVGV